SSAARTSSGPESATTPTSLPSCGARMTALSRSCCFCRVVIVRDSPSLICKQATETPLSLRERFLKVLQLAAVAEAEKPGHAEMIPGAEQDAVLRAQLLDDLEGRNGAAIMRPANRARCRGVPGEGVAEGLEPRVHHRIGRVQDASRAVDDLLAHQRIEGDGGQMIRRARWTNCRIVVRGPRFLPDRPLRRDPTDADP